MSRKKGLKTFDTIVSISSYSERRGRKMIYCSSNEYMYFPLNKDGTIGFRLSKVEQNEFGNSYGFAPLLSYNAVMKDYVKIPESLYEQTELSAKWLDKSHTYVNTLQPK